MKKTVEFLLAVTTIALIAAVHCAILASLAGWVQLDPGAVKDVIAVDQQVLLVIVSGSAVLYVFTLSWKSSSSLALGLHTWFWAIIDVMHLTSNTTAIMIQAQVFIFLMTSFLLTLQSIMLLQGQQEVSPDV